MKYKILAIVLLLCCLAVGFYLPKLGLEVQDEIQAKQTYVFSLPTPKASADQQPSMDNTLWERLPMFSDPGGKYILLDESTNESAVAEPVARVIAGLKAAGIITDDRFQIKALTTQIAVSPLAPDQPLTPWMYTGTNANGDTLTISLDSVTEMAVFIELNVHSTADIPNETQINNWREFIRQYYLASETDEINTIQRSPTEYSFVISNGTDTLELPLQILSLVEVNEASYLYQYRLN